MQQMPHVALLIETSRSYGRGLLRGVRAWVAEHGPWSMYLELRDLSSKPPLWLKRWRGDGILTRTNNQAMADIIAATGVPAVELRASKLKQNLPFAGADNRALGEMVVDHLLDRGFRHFGLYELRTESFFEQRRDNFLQAVTQHGYECHVRDAGDRELPAQWERHQDELAKWITNLPKPVGIMACTDQLGFWLLDACRRADAQVPEEVAVVGVENEEALCTMANPQLSSVQFDAKRTGYQAAGLLSDLMNGKRAVKSQTLVPPLGIVTRQSSDTLAIEDPLVVRALQYIRAHACDGLTVEQLLDHLCVSRSSLERHMRDAIGRSPKAEILRLRLDRVQGLLAETDLSIAAIAEKTGFFYPQYLSEVFKKKLGITPGEFRAKLGR